MKVWIYQVRNDCGTVLRKHCLSSLKPKPVFLYSQNISLCPTILPNQTFVWFEIKPAHIKIAILPDKTTPSSGSPSITLIQTPFLNFDSVPTREPQQYLVPDFRVIYRKMFLKELQNFGNQFAQRNGFSNSNPFYIVYIEPVILFL